MTQKKTQAWGAMVVVILGFYVLARCTEDTAAPTTAAAPRPVSDAASKPTPHPVDETAKLDRISNKKMQAEMSKVNTMYGDDLIKGGEIEDDRCTVRIDGDYYEAASDQDKSLMKELFVKLCSGSYAWPGRHVPDDGLPIAVYNLAGDIVYDDTIVKSQ